MIAFIFSFTLVTWGIAIYTFIKLREADDRFNRLDSLLVENGRINRDTLYAIEQIRDRSIYLTEVKPETTSFIATKGRRVKPKKGVVAGQNFRIDAKGRMVYAPKKKPAAK